MILVIHIEFMGTFDRFQYEALFARERSTLVGGLGGACALPRHATHADTRMLFRHSSGTRDPGKEARLKTRFALKGGSVEKYKTSKTEIM